MELDIPALLWGGAATVGNSVPVLLTMWYYYRQKIREEESIKRDVASMNKEMHKMTVKIAVLTTQMHSLTSRISGKHSSPNQVNNDDSNAH